MIYTLVARIEHLETGNLINTFEDKDNFKQFNTLESKCDICNTIRYRRITYIVRDENNNLLQVGTSCLNKLFPKMKSEKDSSSFSEMEQLIFGGFKGVSVVSIKTLLANIIRYNLQTDNIPTFNRLENFELTEYEKQEIDNVLEFYKNFDAKNSFQLSLQTLVNRGYVEEKYSNIICYIYKVYQDCYRKKIDDINSLNNSITINNFKKYREYDDYRYSYYGTKMYNYKFNDTNNNTYIYETSRELDDNKMNNKKVSFTIKSAYETIKNAKIIYIKRLKEIE